MASNTLVPPKVDFDNTFFKRSSELVKIDSDLEVNLCGENSPTPVVVSEKACTMGCFLIAYLLRWATEELSSKLEA
jgi:hypothetical protein